jgi:hypothetical protein
MLQLLLGKGGAIMPAGVPSLEHVFSEITERKGRTNGRAFSLDIGKVYSRSQSCTCAIVEIRIMT